MTAAVTPERLFDILKRYAESQGIDLNNDREFALDTITGLLRNQERYGYRSCPCRLATGIKERDVDIICPCTYRDDDVREYGSCYCNFYVSRDWNDGKVPHVVVPERRRKGGHK